MPLPIIATTARVAVKMTHPATLDTIVNVLHFSDVTTADLDTLDVSFESAWYTFLNGYVPQYYVWTDVTITLLDGSPSVVYPWTSPQPSAPTTGLPPNVACCVGWRTALTGRSHRGRSYLGPLDAAFYSATTPDRLVPAKVSSVAADAATFITAMITAGYPLCVASYGTATSTNVLRAVVNPKVCTMRKRVNGR